MLKLIGIENGTVKDEKVLLDEDGRLTSFGGLVLVQAALAVVGAVCLAAAVFRGLGRLFGLGGR